MHIPAWQIATWSEVCVSVHQWGTSASYFRHLGTSAHQIDEQTGLRRGQALWATDAANDIVGLAWDWAEIRPGIMAMADPMTILSNAVLLDDEGHPVDSFKRIIHLNNSVFLIPWQRQISTPEQCSEPLAA